MLWKRGGQDNNQNFLVAQRFQNADIETIRDGPFLFIGFKQDKKLLNHRSLGWPSEFNDRKMLEL